MAESLSIAEALERLRAAAAAVEDALERRKERALAVAGLEGEMHRLGTDRSRLAESLDAAEARAARLAEANAAVSRGLVEAMEDIRDVLERQGA
jgi:hypothetical protein